MQYPVVIQPLDEEDGGGFIAHAVDLKGCFSVGETSEEALTNLTGAVKEWIDAWTEMERPVPEPGSAAQRARKEHERLSRRIEELIANSENIDAKLEELKAELFEHIEHLEGRERFAQITGNLPFHKTSNAENLNPSKLEN